MITAITALSPIAPIGGEGVADGWIVIVLVAVSALAVGAVAGRSFSDVGESRAVGARFVAAATAGVILAVILSVVIGVFSWLTSPTLPFPVTTVIVSGVVLLAIGLVASATIKNRATT